MDTITIRIRLFVVVTVRWNFPAFHGTFEQLDLADYFKQELYPWISTSLDALPQLRRCCTACFSYSARCGEAERALSGELFNVLPLFFSQALLLMRTVIQVPQVTLSGVVYSFRVVAKSMSFFEGCREKSVEKWSLNGMDLHRMFVPGPTRWSVLGPLIQLEKSSDICVPQCDDTRSLDCRDSCSHRLFDEILQ